MTYAQEIAREHIAQRAAEGWTWGEIAEEADRCCLMVGAPCVAALRPYDDAQPWAIERSYALARESVRRKAVAA